ncbi:prepilin peptidase [Microbacterium esteraromaticum]|uniref:prepilin peptidase n=1 Tax=Microbacterium esteraromaticum TaxID=57043 RepID=UPI0019564EBD|nr:A24 family peptidase [Microbacterium esteraromaticum]MBM7465804.1 leader peptidase (prepilin peptidase)/N-methyltransferase [Microbacterium esteraromaticum]
MAAAVIFVAVFAGLFGLAIGSFLNVVAYRVPAGISLLRESRCPGCNASIRWYQNIPVASWLALRRRCASCSTPISARYPLVEAATAVLFAGVAWGVAAGRPLDARPVDGALWFGTAEFWGVLVMLLVFASLSIALTLIDLDTKRLPNAIVLPGWAAIVILLLITTVLSGMFPAAAGELSASPGRASASGEIDWWPFLRALIGGAALYVFYFVVRVISPRGMGGGDVKLAGLVGTVLGWFGWGALAVGAFAAFLLGGVFGICLMLLNRAKRKTAIPFGPWILAGAWVGILIGEPVGRWYLGLYS